MLRQNTILTLLAGMLLFGCSGGSELATKSDTPPAITQTQADPLPSTKDISYDSVEIARPSDPMVEVSRADTSVASDSSETPELSITAQPDSTLEAVDPIAAGLEEARFAYMSALDSEQDGDTSSAESAFEAALELLNRLGEFPEIEQNKDFVELSQSVVEDYERHIERTDRLTDNASVFALREKLSMLVEEAPPDLTADGIPKHDIDGTTVPIPFNDQVERNVKFFMGRGREYYERWLQLAGRYFPMMRRIFKEEGVPEEMIYLSMPESGLRTDARSWVGAVGLWQFMKGTGRLYGLRTSWWYDERRDFEKSTKAAARHLKDLYQEFGDWYLVMGAYNAGPGRIFRAIRRSGSKDFWEMRHHLPRQTRNYIPQYIAVTRLFLQPHLYGFGHVQPEDSLAYDVATVDDCVSLSVLAECAGTTESVLRMLNPELVQWCTPPGVTGYRLRVPVGSVERFTERYAAIPEDQKRDWAMHTVKRGETLSGIAYRYGVSADLLQELNKIKNIRALSVGRTLAIPVPADIVKTAGKVPFDYDRGHKSVTFRSSRSAASRASRPVAVPTGKTKLRYGVKRGDTIGHIAEWFGVRASDIRNWNDISYGRFIYPGQHLAIWVDPSRGPALARMDDMSFEQKQATLTEGARPKAGSRSSSESRGSSWTKHTIGRGETLEKIAEKYGVSIGDIRGWNNLSSSRIRAGDILEIYSVPEERSGIVGPGAPRGLGLPAPRSDKKQPQSGRRTHVVRPGDTLFNIARTYGVEVETIRRANRIVGNDIHPGDILSLPVQTDKSFRYHTVQRGETLWAISREYGVSVSDIQQANEMDEELKSGALIRIPLQ